MALKYLIIQATLFYVCFAVDFDYAQNGENWRSNFPECGGQRQSPINLRGAGKANAKPIGFENYERSPAMQKITNDGHTAKVEYVDSTFVPSIKLDESGDKFQFAQFHFHWGPTDTIGSEHLIDGRSYPLELHLVHWNTKHTTLETALTKGDGIAVLGVLFEISPTDNPIIAEIITSLSDITNTGPGKLKANFPTLMQLLPSDNSQFYRYAGSLTTPKCNEVVIWTVFKNTIKISSAQLAKFRQLKDAKNAAITTNFRQIPYKPYTNTENASSQSHTIYKTFL